MTALTDLEPAALEAAIADIIAEHNGRKYVFASDFALAKEIAVALAARSTVPEAGKAVGRGIAERLHELADSSHSDHDKIRLMLKAAEAFDRRLASVPAPSGTAEPVAFIVETIDGDKRHVVLKEKYDPRESAYWVNEEVRAQYRLIPLYVAPQAVPAEDVRQLAEYWGAQAGLAAALSTEPGEAEGMVLVPKAALDWLFGEGPDDNGYWFGDGHEALNPVGAFWWRTVFNRMLAAAPLPEDTHHGR